MPTEIRLPLTLSLRDRIKAAYFLLYTQRTLNVMVYLFFPLFGLAMFGLNSVLARGASAGSGPPWFVLAWSLLLPLFPAFLVIRRYRANKQQRESFTYVFNDDGVHCDAPSAKLTHPWSSITHVKQRWGFLFFFFTPVSAHCIPLASINQAGVLERLLIMARAHNVAIK